MINGHLSEDAWREMPEFMRPSEIRTAIFNALGRRGGEASVAEVMTAVQKDTGKSMTMGAWKTALKGELNDGRVRQEDDRLILITS